jgi:outer membrane protein
MRMATGTWVDTLVLLSALIGTPPAVLAETLDEALAATIAHNPGLAAQRARLRATRQDLNIARAGYLPKVQVSGAARIGSSDQQLNPDASSGAPADQRLAAAPWSVGYAVSIDQPLFDGFRTKNAINEATANSRAGEGDVGSAEQAILLAAATAYVDVIRDRAILERRRQSVQTLDGEVAAAMVRFQKGIATTSDIAQARARRADSVAQVAAAKAETSASGARYAQVVGHPPAGLSDPSLPRSLLTTSVDAAVGTAMQEHPAIVSALHREEASRHTIEKIWADQLPYVALRASHEGSHFESGAASNLFDASLTARVVVPLYDGGVTSARVQQAKELNHARAHDIQDAKDKVRAKIVEVWSRLAAAREQIKARGESVSANETALQGIREEQRLGQKSLLDVLDGERELVEAQIKLVEAKRDLVQSGYEALASTGKLTVLALEQAASQLPSGRRGNAGSWQTDTRKVEATNQNGSTWQTQTMKHRTDEQHDHR